MAKIHDGNMLILDLGLQYVQLIARRIREIGIYFGINRQALQEILLLAVMTMKLGEKMKKSYQKIVLLSAIIMVLSGCAVATEKKYSKNLDSWFGTHIDVFLKKQTAKLGKVYPLPDGLTAYEYNSYRVETRGGGYTPEVVQVGQQPVPNAYGRIIGVAPIYKTIYHPNPTYDVELVCDTIIKVDKQGIIRAWQWKGNDCKSK